MARNSCGTPVNLLSVAMVVCAALWSCSASGQHGWETLPTGNSIIAAQEPADHPDSWMWANLPEAVKDQIQLQVGPGFSTQLDSGEWVRVNTDSAPTTPLADLTTTDADRQSENYGFPDGRVDAADLDFFLFVLFDQAVALESVDCIDYRDGVANPMIELDSFMESLNANFGRDIGVGRAFVNVGPLSPRPYGKILAWRCRLELYVAVHSLDDEGEDSPDCEDVPLSIEFRHAITSLRTDQTMLGCAGLWRLFPGMSPEPVGPVPAIPFPAFYFEVDNRQVCEDGSSRLASKWTINSSEIGVNSGSSPRKLSAKFVSSCDPSGYYDIGLGACSFATAGAKKAVAVRHTGPCTTKVSARVSATYPFTPNLVPTTLAPVLGTVSHTVHATMATVPDPATPQCSWIYAASTGEHSAFPSFDVRVRIGSNDPSCVYQYNPTGTLPSPGGLTTGVEFSTPPMKTSRKYKVAAGC